MIRDIAIDQGPEMGIGNFFLDFFNFSVRVHSMKQHKAMKRYVISAEEIGSNRYGEGDVGYVCAPNYRQAVKKAKRVLPKSVRLYTGICLGTLSVVRGLGYYRPLRK